MDSDSDIRQLEEENQRLKAFVPDDIINNLPSDLQNILLQEISGARELMVKEDLHDLHNQDSTIHGIQNPVFDEPVTEKEEGVPVTDLEHLLNIVSTLDEDTSKFVYGELQTVLKEVDRDIQYQKIILLKEDLIKLQIEQTGLMPVIPDDVACNLPPEIAEHLQSTMKNALLTFSSKSTEEENESQIEVNRGEAAPPVEAQRPEHFIASSIPEDLLQTLPPEMAEILKANFEFSVAQLSS